MFCEERLMRLARPMPPTPTPAMLSLSLGGTKPRPSTWRGTMVTAAALAAFARNLRREIGLIGGIRVSKQRRPLSRGVGHFGNFSAQNETALLGGPGEAAMG